MQQSTLITAIRDRLLADTGTGGLFNVTTPLLTDVHFARANKQTTGNYIVLVVANTVPEDDFTNNGIIYQINVNIYMTSIYGGTITLSNIIDRVYARLHDWTPTLSDGHRAGLSTSSAAVLPTCPTKKPSLSRSHLRYANQRLGARHDRNHRTAGGIHKLDKQRTAYRKHVLREHERV
jgi:hypothetical protein